MNFSNTVLAALLARFPALPDGVGGVDVPGQPEYELGPGRDRVITGGVPLGEVLAELGLEVGDEQFLVVVR